MTEGIFYVLLKSGLSYPMRAFLASGEFCVKLIASMLVNFHAIDVVCWLFSKLFFFKNWNSFDPNQAQHFVGPCICPNCLPILGNFHAFDVVCWLFAKICFFKKIQTVWIQTKPSVLLVLVCVQNVSKGYKQTALAV